LGDKAKNFVPQFFEKFLIDVFETIGLNARRSGREKSVPFRATVKTGYASLRG
jgi:hypothetical protein